MHHSRSTTARLLAASALLALGGAALWSPPRGLAQQDQNRVRADGSTLASPTGSADDTSSDAMSPDDATSDAGPSGVSSSANSDAGGDSGLGPNGQTVPNPPVGVDATGRSDATATRNGRTTRRRLPVPQNPIQITNSTRGTGSTALGPDARTGRFPLPASPHAPRDYTVPADPSTFGTRNRTRPLPLFGYDFFQPARQIILARRRALLPRPAPRRTGTGTGTRSRAPQSGNGAASTGQGYSDNGGNGTGNDGTSADLGAAAVAGSRGRGPSGDTTGMNADTNGADAGQNDSNGDGTGNGTDASQNGSDARTRNGDTGTSGQDNGSSDTSDNASTNGNGTDAAVNGASRRRRSTTGTNDVTGSDSTFAGDTATPGGDVEFPGDDALVGNGAADAVAGQIADPIATLSHTVLASLPPNYQLQPGDQLTVRYSALTIAPRTVQTTVDFQGGISLPEVGRLSVVGRTSAEAEDTLRRQFSRLYRNVDVSISLRQIRTIQVTVSGAAFAPGTYTVPATATAFNLLNAAGGPNANGSLREIRVLRNGRTAGILDIYPLIGAVSANPRRAAGDVALRSGDNVYVPAPVKRIAIRGEVRQEAIYELTEGETLRDALAYAGGIKPSGVGQNVHVDTTDPGLGRVIRDVAVTSRATVSPVPLFDGDTVEVSSVRAILTNRVTIEGAVDQPGDYALTPGMTVLDLIQRARGVIFNTYLGRADLVRTNPDFSTNLTPLNLEGILDGGAGQNVALKRFDRVRLYTRQEVAYLGRRVVTVRGAVQRPGTYTQSENLRVSDLLLQAGGTLPDAYLNRAILLHQRGDGTFAYDFVNLRAIRDGGDVAEDLPVEDNDILAVYRIGEAHFTPEHNVKVLGDVVAPGLYPRGEGMKLSDLLKLAGAFKPGGGTRVMIAHARRPITTAATQIAPINIAYNGPGTLDTDVPLEDGDVVTVQGDGSIKDHPAIVTVTGAVNQPGPFPVTRGMRLSDAVREAGGLRAEAFPQGAEFTRTADTQVTTGQLGLAQIISQMSDMLNLTQFQRERARSNLELITAAGSAASGSSGGVLGGLTPGASSNPNPNLGPLIGQLTQNNLVSQGRILTPSQLQPNGTVAVRLADALRRPGGTEDVLIKDGDTLVVPETPTTVQVVGAVFSPSGVVFRPGQSIDYYIKYAGGFTPDSAEDRIEVIHAGGGLIPASKAGAIQPGDLILVPTKVLAEKVSRSGGGFNAFFQGLVGSAITLKVLSSVFGL